MQRRPVRLGHFDLVPVRVGPVLDFEHEQYDEHDYDERGGRDEHHECRTLSRLSVDGRLGVFGRRGFRGRREIVAEYRIGRSHHRLAVALVVTVTVTVAIAVAVTVTVTAARFRFRVLLVVVVERRGLRCGRRATGVRSGRSVRSRHRSRRGRDRRGRRGRRRHRRGDRKRRGGCSGGRRGRRTRRWFRLVVVPAIARRRPVGRPVTDRRGQSRSVRHTAVNRRHNRVRTCENQRYINNIQSSLHGQAVANARSQANPTNV